MRIDAAWLDTHEWMLRSTDNGKAYGGFKYPRKGVWVTCQDWNPNPVCGGGFDGHG